MKYFTLRFDDFDHILDNPHRALAEWLNEIWESQHCRPLLITPITAPMSKSIEAFDVVFEMVDLQ